MKNPFIQVKTEPFSLPANQLIIAPKSLRRNLLIWLLLPLITLFAARSFYTHFVTSVNIATRVYDRALYDSAKSLAQQVSFESNGSPSLKLSNMASQILLSDDNDKIFFTVRDKSGQILAGNKKLPPPDNNHLNQKQPTFFNGSIEGEKIRAVTLKLVPSTKQQDHFVIIEVAETLNKRKLLEQEVFDSTIFPQAMLIVLATITVWIGVGKGLAPLRVLQRDLAQRSHRDLSPVNANLALQEVRPIIHTINDLMGQLSHALGVQSRFAADAAHQLRTPLAGLKAQLELVSRQASMEDMKTELKPLTIASDRMCRLVNQLLAVACNDHESGHIKHFKSIDLNTLVANTTREWVPEALHKKIDLGFTGDQSPTTIFGDAGSLRELVANLLDNAIRYTQECGYVTARVVTHPPTLIIEDNGEGIPPEERQRVFERFYRVLGNRADGSGLGLSIVQEIALAHNAKIQLGENTEGKGTVVTIVFPTPSNSPSLPVSTDEN